MRWLIVFVAFFFMWNDFGVAKAAEKDEPLKIQVSENQITFLAGKVVITTYNIGKDVAKPYFWPLNAPGAIPVTRAWPMKKGLPGETIDHIHQKSAWFCHGDVIPEGLELKSKIKGVEGVDFWSENKGHGRMVCTNVSQAITHGPDHISISTHNEWQTSEGVKILDGDRVIHCYRVAGGYLIVLEIDLHASVYPILFGDTKEGSMGVRVHDAMTLKAKGGNFENAESKKNDKEVWGLPSVWCDYSGKVDGKEVGIAIFDDPKNVSKAHWHSRDYGLMAANPFGRNRSGFPAQKGKTDLVHMAKGSHLILRYGMFSHTGNTQTGNVREAYEHFVKLSQRK